MPNSYPPELYAKLHRGNPGDLAFYRETCRGAQRILELGCGYGRVLDVLRDEARQRLIGLDRDRGLLELARRRLGDRHHVRAELVQGDMRLFSFGDAFDRILIPYSAIYCLLTIPDLHECLAKISEHLADDGLLIFDAYSADGLHEEDDGTGEEDEPEEIARIEYRGTSYHVIEQSEWSRDAQRLDVTYLHEPREGGTTIATHLHHRYLLADQIPHHLESAGLELVTLSGSYDGTPITDDTDLLIATARRT